MPDRTTPPPFQSVDTLHLLKAERLALSNGLELYTVRGGDQEIVRLEMIFEAGKWYETQVGLSHFTAAGLNRGTRDKTSFEVAEVFDRYGAYLEISPGYDFVTISLYSLKKWLPALLDLFFDVLTEPVFPEEEVDQLKSIYLENLKVNNQKIEHLASKHFRKNVFGATHPYGCDVEEADVKAIARERLAGYHARSMVRPSIWMVGNLDEEVIQAVQRHAERWNVSIPLDRPLSISRPDPSAFHLPREDSVQSAIRLGRTMPTRKSPDYPSLLLLTHVLGGYFGSRLMQSVREERGLTYGIHATLHAFRNGGFLGISTEVNKERLEAALDAIRGEVRRLRDEPVRDEELTTARNHFVGSFVTEINNCFAHAERRKNIVLYGLEGDYYEKLLRQVSHKRAEELMETAESYFNLDDFSVVTVG